MTLQEMVELQVITPVTHPSEGVSSLTYPHMPDGTLCICLDPYDWNKAITHEQDKAPSLDEISYQLNGAKTFSKMNAKYGFWSIHLNEASSYHI